MTELAVKIDNEYVSINKCDWVKYSPCGHPTGVMVARYAPTEEQAWVEFYDLKRDRDKARKAGVRFELMTHARYRAEILPQMQASVPHTCETGEPR